MPAYDRPFFKRLRKNDIGYIRQPDGSLKRTSNQGGPAIPKGLRSYFPPLPNPKDDPTEEYHIRLDMFDGPTPVGVTVSRWHYQTWGKRRAQETRLTQNIVPLLLKTAAPGDVLLFERELEALDRYRVTLLRMTDPADAARIAGLPSDRWGPTTAESPESLVPVERNIAQLERAVATPPVLFEDRRLGTPHQRFLRSAAFSRIVKRAYDRRCAVCNTGYVAPVDNALHEPPTEPAAAHIIPVSQNGSDDPRNGICLCQTHHWVFDNGLIYVGDDDRWHVIDRAKTEPRNHGLLDIENTHVTQPVRISHAPAREAIEWHRRNVARVG